MCALAQERERERQGAREREFREADVRLERELPGKHAAEVRGESRRASCEESQRSPCEDRSYVCLFCVLSSFWLPVVTAKGDHMQFIPASSWEFRVGGGKKKRPLGELRSTKPSPPD